MSEEYENRVKDAFCAEILPDDANVRRPELETVRECAQAKQLTLAIHYLAVRQSPTNDTVAELSDIAPLLKPSVYAMRHSVRLLRKQNWLAPENRQNRPEVFGKKYNNLSTSCEMYAALPFGDGSVFCYYMKDHTDDVIKALGLKNMDELAMLLAMEDVLCLYDEEELLETSNQDAVYRFLEDNIAMFLRSINCYRLALQYACRVPQISEEDDLIDADEAEEYLNEFIEQDERQDDEKIHEACMASESIASLLTKLSGIQEDALNFVYEFSDMNRELNKLREENSALATKVSQQQRQIRKLEHALHKKENPANDEEELEEEIEPEEPLTTSKTEEPERLPLPKSGVLVIGGHPNQLPKIKARYPDWDYFNTEDGWERRSFPRSEVVIMLTEYMSHKLFYTISGEIKRWPHKPIVLHTKKLNSEHFDTDLEEQFARAVNHRTNG